MFRLDIRTVPTEFGFDFHFIIHLNTHEGFVSTIMLVSDVCLDILDIISKYMCRDNMETCKNMLITYIDKEH